MKTKTRIQVVGAVVALATATALAANAPIKATPERSNRGLATQPLVAADQPKTTSTLPGGESGDSYLRYAHPTIRMTTGSNPCEM